MRLTSISMNRALPPFLALAAVGLLLSIAAHVLSLFGRTIPGGELVWSLHMGIFVVWLPTVLVFVRISKTTRRNDAWKVALSGCPPWARYVLYALFAYAIGSFILATREIEGHPQASGDAPPSIIRAFSGHWMIFYGVAFATLYSVTKRPELLRYRKCGRGHKVSPADKFCPACGCVLEGNAIE